MCAGDNPLDESIAYTFVSGNKCDIGLETSISKPRGVRLSAVVQVGTFSSPTRLPNSHVDFSQVRSDVDQNPKVHDRTLAGRRRLGRDWIDIQSAAHELLFWDMRAGAVFGR